MKLKIFLILTSFVYIPFGIAMVLFPYKLFGLYGFNLNMDGAILGRVVGAAIIGLGLINFLSRNEKYTSRALKAVLFGNIVYHLLDIVIVFIPTYNNILNELSWSFVGLHIILSIGFAYYLIRMNARNLK